MLVRKSTVANLEVGGLYVAFSAKSKMLSSNGNKGVFVLVKEVMGKDVKVYIPSLNKTMVLKRLDERQDAWMYSPDDSLKVLVNGADKAALFPKFTPRMNDAFEGKTMSFKPDALYKHEREGEGNGQTFYRFRGEDNKMNTFNFAWIKPDTAPEWRIPRAQRMGIGAVEVALPPKPVSAEEETLIEFLGASIEKFNKEKKENHTATFVMLNEKGAIIKTQYTGACHYALKEKGGIRYVISGICRREQLDEALHKKYITYLTTESPFKDAFLIKNADWIWKNGYILTGNVSAQMMGGACIATRQAWENPQFVEAWMGLAEQGLPLNVAFLFGSYALKSSNGKFAMGAGSSGHTVFSLSGMEEAAMVNFIDAKPVAENKKTYYEQNNYEGVNAMWGKIYGNAPSVLAKLKAIGGAGKWGASNYIDKTDCMEQAADIIEDWMKGAGV